MDWGWVRFRIRGDAGIASPNPRLDPNCLTLWGTKKESGSSALLATAIVGRMAHPNAAAGVAAGGGAGGGAGASAGTTAPAATNGGGDHDAMLRRLRELGELHRDGVLTDEEFAAAKQAVLKQL
jgi:hypothetical protein